MKDEESNSKSPSPERTLRINVKSPETNSKDFNISNPYFKMKQLFKKSIRNLKGGKSPKKGGNGKNDDAASQASEDIEKMIEDPFSNVAIS
jgi:hypothetical protein